MHALTGQNQNHLFTSNQIVPNTVIKITEAIINEIQKKPILFILKIEIVDNKVNSVIGNPQAGGSNSQGKEKENTKTISNPKILEKKEPPKQQEKPIQKTTPQQQKTPQKTPQKQSTVVNRNQSKKSPISKGDIDLNPQPISTLSVYQSNWCIKARITKRSDIRNWENKERGTKGKLFSVDLVDEQDTEIRATLFNDVAEKYYEEFQVGNVFIIARGSLKPAKKQYSNIKNDFEINFDDNTIVERCDDDNSIPVIKYSLTNLEKLSEVKDGEFIDVCGVVDVLGDLKDQVSKNTNKAFKMRNLNIVDGKISVEMTLFGDQAERQDIQKGLVLLCKGVKKSVFSGISLSTQSSTTIIVNPDIPEAHHLKEIYEKGPGEKYLYISQRTDKGMGTTKMVTLSEIQELGKSEKGDYVNCYATISYIKKDSLYYPSCTQSSVRNNETIDCKKKVTQNGDGKYMCEHHGEMDNCQFRYLSTFVINDKTGHRWVSCFDDVAINIIGYPANELANMKDNSPDEFEKVITDVNFKCFLFKLKVKEEENRNGYEKTLKVVINKVLPADYSKLSSQLLQEIEKYK